MAEAGVKVSERGTTTGMITGSQSAADRIAVNFQAIAVAAQLFVQITKPLKAV